MWTKTPSLCNTKACRQHKGWVISMYLPVDWSVFLWDTLSYLVDVAWPGLLSAPSRRKWSHQYLFGFQWLLNLPLPCGERALCAPLMLIMVGWGISFAPVYFQAKFLCAGRSKAGLGSAHPPTGSRVRMHTAPSLLQRTIYEPVSHIALHFCPCVFHKKKDLCLSTDCKN